MGDRAAFLAEACGDDAKLRAEAESLLANADGAASFLEGPALEGSPSLVGRQLAAYRIEAAIGAGGMGEVYRAKDTRLGRDVAVKILPAVWAADPQRRSRFEREARTIAALNHPNICTIHDVGHEDGIHFLVMELVDGESLATRLAQGPLPLTEALSRAIEIAEALDRAHQQGIIHRDLKPGNVMLARTSVGTQAKLLDFGLARIVESPADAGLSPTAGNVPMTEAGAMLGTLPYAAPEQIEGRPTDARTDIFAFGTLLYEIVSGRRPFEGASSAALMATILREDPLPVDPPAVGRVIRRCLAKNPLRRYQSARDLLNDLAEAKDAVESASREGGDRIRTPSRRGRSVIAKVVTVCAGLLVVAYAGRDWFMARPDVMSHRFQLQPPRGVGVDPSSVMSALAISPDGRWVAFRGWSAGNQVALYVRYVGDIESQRIAVDGNGPFFSPDSRWVGFVAGRTMYKVPLASAQSQPQRICDLPNTTAVRGVSWADDDTIVFSFERALWRVPAAGGEPTQLTRPGSATSNVRHYWPHVLPGSAAAVFTVNEGYNDRWRRIAVVSLATGEIRSLPGLSGTAPRYVSSHLLYSRFGSLHAVPFDVSRQVVTGEPVMVLDDVQTFAGSGSVGFDVSQSGSLVYIPEAYRFPRGDIVWLDREGGVTPLESEPRSYIGAALDHDGKRLVAAIADDFGEGDLALLELESHTWTRLTRDMHAWSEMAWSPDGRWIYFTSYKSGDAELYRVAAGGGAPEQLTSDLTVWEHPGSVTPDGRTLLYWHTQLAQADLMRLALDPRGTPQHLTASPAVFEAGPRVSPDGRWMAFGSDASGGGEVYVAALFSPDKAVRVTRTGGWAPVWRHDSAELFFQRGAEVWSVIVQSARKSDASFHHRPPQLLFTAGEPGGAETYRLLPQAVSNRFAAIRGESPHVQLVYSPNWLDELKRRMHERRPSHD